MMARAFGVPPLLLGFGTPGGRAHGPDEAMDLPGWAAAVDTSAALFAALAWPIRADGVSARPQELSV
jgi:succinyl-diaminopimelate desuccinylase